MPYVDVVDFTEVCSIALLKAVDVSFDDMECANEKIYVDLKKTTIKNIIRKQAFKYLYTCKRFGKNLVVVKTCKPAHNWRKEARGSAIKSGRYNISDESILIDGNSQLEYVFDSIWKNIMVHNNFISISHKNMDFYDIALCMKSLIGDEYCTKMPANYLLLTDANLQYDRTDSNISPSLMSDIKSNCVAKGIL
jgi:hypothetical protein